MNAVQPESLATALFLSIAIKAIIDYLAEPVRQKYPTANLWWLVYVSFVVGAACSWLGSLDLFALAIPTAPVLTRVLTAAVIGGGASLIHDVFDSPVA